MKIAVASMGLDVSPYFDMCDGFMCYTIDRCVVTDCRNMPNLKFTTVQILDIFTDLKIDTLLCGNLVAEAATLFHDAGIEVVTGCKGSTNDAISAYLTDVFGCSDDDWNDDWDDDWDEDEDEA